MPEDYKFIQNMLVVIGCTVGGFLFSTTGFKDLSSMFAGVILSVTTLGFLTSLKIRVLWITMFSIIAVPFAHNFYLFLAGACIGIMYMLASDSIRG